MLNFFLSWKDEKTGRLESLREISDSTATRRAKQQLELLAAAAGPEQQQQQKGEEGGTSLLPGCYYIDETLVLDCAWDSCPETFSKVMDGMNREHYLSVFLIRMDPCFFADPYPDFKIPDPSINKLVGSKWCFWLVLGGIWPKY